MTCRTAARRWLPVLALFALGVACHAGVVSGRVFCDRNADGAAQADELGIAGVRVSDGTTVVLTDARGAYALPASEGYQIVTATTPTDYAAPGGFWRGVETSGAAPVVDFALVPERQSRVFYLLQGTDVHVVPKTVSRVQAMCAEINVMSPRPAFMVMTGDLVMDVLPAKDDAIVHTLYDAYQAGVKDLAIPLRNLPGNHEHVGYANAAYPRENVFFGKGAYRHILGPTHYAWEYGGWLFLALDATMPKDPPGSGYRELITPECMQWLRAELSHVSATQPVVVFLHEPAAGLSNRDELAALLTQHNLRGVYSGHLHTTQQKPFAGIIEQVGGAVSGAWWNGACPDGSPQGYRIIRCAGVQIASFYQATGKPHHVDILTPAPNAVVTPGMEVVASVWDPADEMVEGRATLGGKALKTEVIYRGAWKEVRAWLEVEGLAAGDCELQVGGVNAAGDEWLGKRKVKIGG